LDFAYALSLFASLFRFRVLALISGLLLRLRDAATWK